MHSHADHRHDEDDEAPHAQPAANRAGAADRRPLVEDGFALLAVSVGNTNTRFVTYHAGHHHEGVSLPNADLVSLAAALQHASEHLEGHDRTAVVFASTNHAFRDELYDALTPTLKHEAYRLGIDLEIPVRHALSDEAALKTGQDRLLNAAAAFERTRQASVVVSAGTAMTVDFVDGEGVFQGGAILPGLRMWLRSMHDGTSALPLVEPARPDEHPFGRDTHQAMLHGAFHGFRGAVRAITERYAESYGAYPRVVATGGDAKFLFESDEFIEMIEPDLTLEGIALACREALGEEG